MRAIKFRVWYKPLRKMYTINGMTFDAATGDVYGVHFPVVYLAIRNDIDLMQYTGLKDKNGKEIYEGDICTIKDGMVYSSTAHRMVEGRYQVYWNDDRWGLRHGELEDYDNGDYYHGDEITWRECEIIGNIYENPELL